MTAMALRNRGLLSVADIPDVPRDADVISEEELSVYVWALERNGFLVRARGT